MIEFVDSDLYFVQDKNNFINPLLQVGSGSGGPKITGSGSGSSSLMITHNFMLEYVDSDLYFVQDKNNFINPWLQVGSGSAEKSTGSRSGGPKINGPDRIRILIPVFLDLLFLLLH